MNDTCSDCGHTKEYNNNHGPDQEDYQYDPALDKLTYIGSCVYCKLCIPHDQYGLYLQRRMEATEYYQLTREEQNNLWIEYHKKKENKNVSTKKN